LSSIGGIQSSSANKAALAGSDHNSALARRNALDGSIVDGSAPIAPESRVGLAGKATVAATANDNGAIATGRRGNHNGMSSAAKYSRRRSGFMRRRL